ncbi:hypothetical protein LIER_40413 [Lithospermum erythrorhizon]|uniref:Uncharacterized protein n=1 Tax=Lithospermum erythrorhizon TaxID=34254 RepID=A0AAV3QU28_LITER
MKILRDFVADSELIDLGFVGHPFTWWNRREGEHVVEARLDRVLSNAKWCLDFPRATSTHLDMVGVDYCPLLLDTEASLEKSNSRFVFDQRWVGKEGCEETIKEAWGKEVRGGS